MITFDEFKKTELRVATIEAAERVEGSDKLIKLQLDLGTDPSTSSGQGKRQIVAGIGKRYSPEELIGKQIVIVANLAPRALMGIESHGMLLAASSEEGPILLMPDAQAPSGAQVG
ncbi:MAG: methionine--tRNA ligase subunit beta [Candidatus Azambacteria bacterium]|nr:methionine--tRNA ligase subunit beta [Candidatus Azambacteria bacterium]